MVYLFKYGIIVPLIASLIINSKRAYKVELPSGLITNVYESDCSVI